MSNKTIALSIIAGVVLLVIVGSLFSAFRPEPEPATSNTPEVIGTAVLECDGCSTPANIWTSGGAEAKVLCQLEWGDTVTVYKRVSGDRRYVSSSDCQGYIHQDSIVSD